MLPNSRPFVCTGAWGLGPCGLGLPLDSLLKPHASSLKPQAPHWQDSCSALVRQNIVEGCARSSQGDHLRFLDIAFASSRELLYLTDLSMRLGFLSEEACQELTRLGDRTAGKLSNLRDSLGS